MKSRYFLGIALVFSLTSASNFASAQKNEAMEFAIKGKITDSQTKKPIADCIVKLDGSDGSSEETITNKKGWYKFDEKIKHVHLVKANTDYTVSVAKDGYVSASQDETTKGAEESQLLQMDFVLEKVE